MMWMCKMGVYYTHLFYTMDELAWGHLGFGPHLVYVIKYGTYFCKLLAFGPQFGRIR